MKIFLDTNIFPEFIDRRVTTGSGHFVTVEYNRGTVLSLYACTIESYLYSKEVA